MKNSFLNSDHIFHPGEYKCVDCDHETIIFIRSDYNLFGCMETDKICSNCGNEHETLSDGDLIMRYDWPDPDAAPWQLQSAFMLDEDRYCDNCYHEVEHDWKKMVVACSRCDGYMKFQV